MALPHRLPLQLITKPATHYASLEAELAPAILDTCSTLLREYSELAKAAPVAFAACEHELMSWYGELQYKTRGAGRCSLCRCSVRHALKVRAERTDGSTRTYVCLCTRCMVAEEADSFRLLLMVDGRWLESRAHAKRQHHERPLKQAA